MELYFFVKYYVKNIDKCAYVCYNKHVTDGYVCWFLFDGVSINMKINENK